ncbi:hypothetical protein, partial [Phyllobacterium zundukense]|uniref:hypothetical protein n=1 Tax=Phyllobacterium zundukense TaxID=1867719 RepID=UPI001A9FA633
MDFVWQPTVTLPACRIVRPETETASSGTGGRSTLTPRRQAEGAGADYSNKAVRDSEREAMGNAEEVYRRFVAAWKQQLPNRCPGAA